MYPSYSKTFIPDAFKLLVTLKLLNLKFINSRNVCSYMKELMNDKVRKLWYMRKKLVYKSIWPTCSQAFTYDDFSFCVPVFVQYLTFLILNSLIKMEANLSGAVHY